MTNIKIWCGATTQFNGIGTWVWGQRSKREISHSPFPLYTSSRASLTFHEMIWHNSVVWQKTKVRWRNEIERKKSLEAEEKIFTSFYGRCGFKQKISEVRNNKKRKLKKQKWNERNFSSNTLLVLMMLLHLFARFISIALIQMGSSVEMKRGRKVILSRYEEVTLFVWFIFVLLWHFELREWRMEIRSVRIYEIFNHLHSNILTNAKHQNFEEILCVQLTQQKKNVKSNGMEKKEAT